MAYDIIILVREECKQINAKPKRSESCVCIQQLEFIFIGFIFYSSSPNRKNKYQQTFFIHCMTWV
jgi:hypothetical protein